MAWYPQTSVVIRTTGNVTSRHGKMIAPTENMQRPDFNPFTSPVMYVTWILVIVSLTLSIIALTTTKTHNIVNDTSNVKDTNIVKGANDNPTTIVYPFNIYEDTRVVKTTRYPPLGSKTGIPNAKWGISKIVSVCCDNNSVCFSPDDISLKTDDSLFLEISHTPNNTNARLGSTCILIILNN